MSHLIGTWYLTVDGSQMKDYSLPTGAAVYSNAVNVNYSRGHAALLVELSGGSDDVDIDFETSLDGKTFYTPYDADGNDVGNVITDNTCKYSTRTAWWIILAPQIAKYIRFKFDPDADSVITARYIQEE